MKKGKRYTQASSKIVPEKLYPLSEAVALLSELPGPKFDETIEVHFRLGVDPRKANQMVRGTVVLPHGTGKSVKVLVFAEGEKAEEAKKAGADFVGMEDLATQIKGGWTDFDVAIATPNMMKNVGKLARILGPRKLMPNPKAGTVTMDVVKAINEAKAGKVEYRVDKFANIHVAVGKKSFDQQKIYENISTLTRAIVRDKPAASKGRYMLNMALCSTMSPSIKIDTGNYLKEIQGK